MHFFVFIHSAVVQQQQRSNTESKVRSEDNYVMQVLTSPPVIYSYSSSATVEETRHPLPIAISAEEIAMRLLHRTEVI